MAERPIIPGWPSVTQVLAAHGFYDSYDEPFIDSQAAMRRGLRVDMACNLLAAYGGLEEGWIERHPECAPYVMAYQKFLSEHRLKLIACQFEVKHRVERYVGHPDQLCELDDNRFCLLSLKTGAHPEWCRVQEAAYCCAMRSMPEFKDLGRIRRAVLQLKSDGLYVFRYLDNPMDFDHWLLLVRSYHVKVHYVGAPKNLG